jgi:hypothetical protein
MPQSARYGRAFPPTVFEDETLPPINGRIRPPLKIIPLMFPEVESVTIVTPTTQALILMFVLGPSTLPNPPP